MMFIVLISLILLSNACNKLDNPPRYNTNGVGGGVICPGVISYDLGKGYNRIDLELAAGQNSRVSIQQGGVEVASCNRGKDCVIGTSISSSKKTTVIIDRQTDKMMNGAHISKFKIDTSNRRGGRKLLDICEISPEINTDPDYQDGKTVYAGCVYSYSIPPSNVLLIDASFSNLVSLEIKQKNKVLYSGNSDIFFGESNFTGTITDDNFDIILSGTTNATVEKINITPFYEDDEVTQTQQDNGIAISALVISLVMLTTFINIICKDHY